MFTVEDISNRYGVKQHTVLGWIRAGELKAVNVGRTPGKLKPRWRIPQTAVDAFEASRTATAAAPRRRRSGRPGGDVIEFYAT